MNVCTLTCETCGLALTVAQHIETCDDPSAHGSIAMLSAAHLDEHAGHTLTVTSETEAEYLARMDDEAAARAAAAAEELVLMEERAEADRDRMARQRAEIEARVEAAG